MNRIKTHPGWLALLATLTLSPLPLDAKENSAAMDLARQLNQAFIEVADKVSPAVVVIKLAHKPDYPTWTMAAIPSLTWFRSCASASRNSSKNGNSGSLVANR